MQKTIKQLFFKLIIITSYILYIDTSYALGTINQFNFVLDTSLQSSLVQINYPQFPRYNPDVQKFIICTNPRGGKIPIFIEGMQIGTYVCTQTPSAQGLPHSQFSAIFTILVDEQVMETSFSYEFYPGDTLPHLWNYAVLLYRDANGKLSYRYLPQ